MSKRTRPDSEPSPSNVSKRARCVKFLCDHAVDMVKDSHELFKQSISFLLDPIIGASPTKPESSPESPSTLPLSSNQDLCESERLVSNGDEKSCLQRSGSNPSFCEGVVEVERPNSVTRPTVPSGRTQACNGWQTVCHHEGINGNDDQPIHCEESEQVIVSLAADEIPEVLDEASKCTMLLYSIYLYSNIILTFISKCTKVSVNLYKPKLKNVHTFNSHINL